ncbi:MAG: hypothetical protein V1929_13460 [bacterium]
MFILLVAHGVQTVLAADFLEGDAFQGYTSFAGAAVDALDLVDVAHVVILGTARTVESRDSIVVIVDDRFDLHDTNFERLQP